MVQHSMDLELQFEKSLSRGSKSGAISSGKQVVLYCRDTWQACHCGHSPWTLHSQSLCRCLMLSFEACRPALSGLPLPSGSHLTPSSHTDITSAYAQRALPGIDLISEVSVKTAALLLLLGHCWHRASASPDA